MQNIHLPKLPNDLSESLDRLKSNRMINEAFGSDVINSYLKLRSAELGEFNNNESFDKTKPVTEWERRNTLDC